MPTDWTPGLTRALLRGMLASAPFLIVVVPFAILFGVVATGLGEALVMYVLGLPLLTALKRFGVVKQPDA